VASSNNPRRVPVRGEAARRGEQLALEHAFGDRAAVHRDERPAARALEEWMARATSSLPVRFRPHQNGGIVSATRAAVL